MRLWSSGLAEAMNLPRPGEETLTFSPNPDQSNPGNDGVRAARTHYHSVQADVGENPSVNRGHVTLEEANRHHINAQRRLPAHTFISHSVLTSSHSVAPTLPYSPALQLANTRLLLGLNPPDKHTHTQLISLIFSFISQRRNKMFLRELPPNRRASNISETREE